MSSKTHIRTSKRIYHGVYIFSALFLLFEWNKSSLPFKKFIVSTPAVIALLAIVYAVYKLFWGQGKIILSETGFKVGGHGWLPWNELVYIYPAQESDTEETRNYIRFKLIDGTELSVRSNDLELSFEEVADLVNSHKNKFVNSTTQPL